MQLPLTDTHPKIAELQLQLIRQASIVKRISIMRSLTQSTILLSRRAIQRANPNLDTTELNRKFISYYYGEKLTPPTAHQLPTQQNTMNNPDLLQAIEPIITAFETLGIHYYIGGSVASSAYGIARSTMDIDMISNINIEHIPPLVKMLEPHYYLDADMLLDAIKHQSSFNILHLETMLKIDVFIHKNTPYALTTLARKKPDIMIVPTLQRGNDLQRRNDLKIYLASPEDIILNKLMWFRAGGSTSERQWNDVLGIIKVQTNSLDKKYLHSWAIELKVNDLLETAFQQATTSPPAPSP